LGALGGLAQIAHAIQIRGPAEAGHFAGVALQAFEHGQYG
jgi:hypothetical protein